MTRTYKSLAAVGRYFALSASLLVILFSNAGIALAGFGITPPYIDNDRLTRGSVYRQTINLVRSDPNETLKADVTINVPGAEDWISIDKGLEFDLPQGQNLVPIVVTVRVPQSADPGELKGAIRIRTSAVGPTHTGAGVSIALGAQIDVRMKVVDKILDFNIRRIRLLDLEEGRTRFGLFFPGKIRFFMTVENTGNAPFGPTRVHFDIYDNRGEQLLESVDNLNSIERVPPFGTQEVVAELPTRLHAGLYLAKYTIYKNEEISQQGQVHLSILTVGSLPGYQGFGLEGLSLQDKLKLTFFVGIPLAFFIVLIYLLLLRRRRRRRR